MFENGLLHPYVYARVEQDMFKQEKQLNES